MNEKLQVQLPQEIQQAIFEVLKRDNVAEIKKEKDNIVVIEQNRKLKVKSPFEK